MNEAWDQFWAVAQGGAGGGCFSDRWQGIQIAQRQVWQEFAKTLPKGARVLDLATGNGVVMGWLIAARRDAKPIGIDLAETIPAPPKGCRSRGGISMEALPFADATQDAVVSQFGVEYGNMPAVLSEISRVLKSSGRVGLMTHRLDGTILEHNRSRREQLAWALDEADLLGKARASLMMREIGIGLTPALADAPAQAKARFGAGSAGWEFAEAVVQTLVLGRGDSPKHVLEVLASLEAKAGNEIGRIDSLERACRAVADATSLQELFEQSGLRLDSRRAVNENQDGRLFADAWILRKNPASPS